jgi:hypothetical protein
MRSFEPFVQFPEGIAIAVPSQQVAGLLVQDPPQVHVLSGEGEWIGTNIDGEAVLRDDVDVRSPGSSGSKVVLGNCGHRVERQEGYISGDTDLLLRFTLGSQERGLGILAAAGDELPIFGVPPLEHGELRPGRGAPEGDDQDLEWSSHELIHRTAIGGKSAYPSFPKIILAS